MSNFNKMILMGRMVRDVEVRTTTSGTTVGKFGMAVNTYRGEGKDDEVLFIDCVAFGKTAENLGRFFSKGDPIFLEGRLTLNQWTDKQSGAKRSKHEVLVDRWQFIQGIQGKDDSSSSEVPF